MRPSTSMSRVWPALFLAVAVAVPKAALAHGGAEVGEQPWDTWNITWDVAVPTVLIVAIYVAGILARRTTDGRMLARDTAFLVGTMFVFLALASPVDPLAERSFVMHQVQHLLLRMAGPMLIALAAPQAVLLRGLPRSVRDTTVTPVMTAAPVRNVFAWLTQPVVATALFIAGLYVWQMPYLHNLSILNEAVHYAMHATMLVTGLLFWWRIFDHRPPPQGSRYGVRLFMLWIMILSNIVIGAYLALKTDVLYPAYDQLGRIFESNALADEQLGAVTMWVPGSMMGIIGAVVVIHMWGRAEGRWDHRDRGLSAGGARRTEVSTAEDLYARQRAGNRRMALGFLTFVLAVFVSAISTGLLQMMAA